MKKFYYWSVLILMMIAFLPEWADAQSYTQRETHVTVSQAMNVGYTFMRTGGGSTSSLRGATQSSDAREQMMQLVYTGQAIDSLTGVITDCYYVFALQPKGFVIVAADERVEPILGYSYDNNFVVEGMPDNVRTWLGYYEKQIKDAVHNDIQPSIVITENWSRLKSGQAMPTRSVTAVSPLIQTTWNQDAYYNQLCPEDANGPNGHVYTGCVATAIAQIIRYWQWPNQGFNSHSYDHSTYGTLSVDYNAAAYNYNDMPNVLNTSSSSTQVNEVAKLMYHCGVAVDMNYSPGGSSAYFFYIPSALYNYFAFADNGTYVYRSNYSDDDWANLIRQELNNARPVFYSGQGSGGHAFVCDGYDNSGNFHINWGWGGYCDGDYTLNALTPGGNNFNYDHEAIIGISATGSFIRCSTSELVLNAPDGGESDAQTLSVRGHSLSGNINVTVGSGFKVSTDGSNYSTSASLSSTGGTLYVKYTPTSSNDVEYTMTLTSGSCSASVTLLGSSSMVQCVAPKNLTGTHNGSAVNLSWNVPVTYSSGSPSSADISWETGSNITSYYGYHVVSNCMVHRFEPSDLTPYNQYLLTAVSFIGSPYATSYSVVVFKGGSYNGSFNSGEMVVNQVVPFSTVNTNGWNTVALTNPVLVDATSELWFGVVATGSYVIPYIQSEAVSNKGNVLGFADEEGATTFSWNNYNPYPYNIPLKGTLEKITAQVSRYDVYRQSTLIGNTTNTSYTDSSPLNSSCTYTVSAVWNNNCSENATVTVSAPPVTLPTVTTSNVSNITSTTATSGGNVTSAGGTTVTARGVCWSTSQNPTIEDAHTSDGVGMGAFTSNIMELTPNTTYYVRAYATNSVGTAYGEEVTFSTACPGIALPYFENFDSYTQSTETATGVEPPCWELVQEDVTMTADKLPQLYRKASYAHSGKYSLLLNGRCVYAMPALAEPLEVPISQLKLEMYVRQSKAQYMLQVGIWEDDGTFVPVATVNNQSTDVEHVVCSFAGYTGNGRRIAFRNVLAKGYSSKYSVNSIDDISLTDICEPVTLPYSEDFELYTQSSTTATGVEPPCWELVQEDVTMTADKLPQLYRKSSYAHSGKYSLLLNGRCVYAMPALAEPLEVPISQLKLEMYVRQSKAQYMLQVGVWEDDGTFVPVATVNNQSTDVEHVVCSFAGYTGNGRRIAFRNVLAKGYSSKYSVNSIDDISLTDICEPVTLPYSEDFELYTQSTTTATGVEPPCWELVQEDVTMTADKLPQLYRKSSYAHSGKYSLLLNGRCIYAMPALAEPLEVPISQLKLEMYVRQSKAQYMLQVGIWEDDGTFVPVATVNNQSTDVEHVVCSFAGYTGNGRRIAFRNVLAKGYSSKYSVNSIDDISLTDICEPVTLPYSEDFELYTQSTETATGVEPPCWELVQKDVAIAEDKLPQLYRKASYAHSGKYSLLLNGRCVYAMPSLAEPLEVPISQLKLEMYVCQTKPQNMLEVGIWEDDGTFVPVATVNNQTTGVEHVVCSFAGYTGPGHRIAFRNVLANGYSSKNSVNFIDDINITSVGNKNMDVTNTGAAYPSETDASGEMAVSRYLENITLYPNPTTGVVHIDAAEVQRVECYTMMGQVVAEYNEVRDIDISQLTAGVYMLRITLPQGVIMRKVVKR